MMSAAPFISSHGHWLLRLAAVYAGVFGLLTVRSGATVLFGGTDAGAVVPFVLWFNFLAGFAYVAAAFGLWSQQRWSIALAFTIAATTASVFAAFGLHIAADGAYEVRTVAAMTLRTVSWCVIAALAWWLLRRDESR